MADYNNRKVSDKISKIIMYIALAVGLSAICLVLISYIRYGESGVHKAGLLFGAKFLVFTVLVFAYRKIVLGR